MSMHAAAGIRLCAALLLCCGAAAAGDAASVDPLPSSVTIKSPVAGAVVAGEIAVYAEADAGADVAGVRFLLDGAAFGEEDVAAPYETTWDTATGTDGMHTLAALTRLADGRMVYSVPVNVTVANERSSAPPAVRVEETDPAVVYGDNWIGETEYGSWSGGSAKYIAFTSEAAAFATFAFSGTGVSWIGYRGRYGGIVKVYIDGVLADELDTYRPEEEIAVPVYTASGLEPGEHALMIELTGLKNAAALGSEAAIDAFDVFN